MHQLLPGKFSGFGVELRRIQFHDLPLICEYRNQPHILKFMDDVRPVSPRVLEFWFNKIAASQQDFAFIAWLPEGPCAYLDIRNCDFEHGTCVDGIYIFDKNKFGSGLAARIWLCREFILKMLNIKDVISWIRVENYRSIAFYKKMGAELIDTNNDFFIYKQKLKARHRALAVAAARLNLLSEYQALKTFKCNSNCFQ